MKDGGLEKLVGVLDGRDGGVIPSSLIRLSNSLAYAVQG